MHDCIFCKIANKETNTPIIYEDNNILAFNDLHPKAQTHILLIPKTHIPSIAELSEEQAPLCMQLLTGLNTVASKLGISGYRTVINTGKEGGQEIFHLHLHLLHGNLQGF
jgi:histidine triad (HIT) family protein